jgi:hypothetical protein
MTRLTITPGICGFDAVIEEEQITRRKIKVLVKSHCERVIRLENRARSLM